MDITTLDLKQHDMTWYKQLLGTKRANKSTTLNISILTPIGSISFLFLLPAISLPTEEPLYVAKLGESATVVLPGSSGQGRTDPAAPPGVPVLAAMAVRPL
jgi:hypothetical protein